MSLIQFVISILKGDFKHNANSIIPCLSVVFCLHIPFYAKSKTAMYQL